MDMSSKTAVFTTTEITSPLVFPYGSMRLALKYPATIISVPQGRQPVDLETRYLEEALSGPR